MFRVHNVSQWLNLRHLDESLGGAEGLLEAVSFKKATKGMGRRLLSSSDIAEYKFIKIVPKILHISHSSCIVDGHC